MAYYQRYEKDLSGGGGYQTQYWPDSKADDEDVSWIFAPFILLLGGMFKLPLFKNLIGFLICIPVVLVMGILLGMLAVFFVLIGEMVCCWGEILKEFARDMVTCCKWMNERMSRHKEILSTD